MNREEAAKLLPILKAYAEGKVIEQKVPFTKDQWMPLAEELFPSWKDFVDRLRIQPIAVAHRSTSVTKDYKFYRGMLMVRDKGQS